MPPLIRLDRLSKTFRPGVHPVTALREIDLEVEAGEFVAIMGPSGSGKSTLLYILGCLDQPTGGKYYLDGEEVSRLDLDGLAKIRNQKIGIVFQNFFLLPRHTALENVELPLLYTDMDSASRRRRAQEILDQVGLSGREDHLPAQLSGGQMQRVAIARALVNNPEMLLADEPTGNLDMAASQNIMEIFRNLNQSRHLTLIMVTHDPEMAEYAGRQVVLRDGVVVTDKRTEQPRETLKAGH
jgi:putative ABC transport system ATP-binding protein